MISYGNFKLLLSGDIDEVITDQITQSAGDIDVLKAPHHGSRTGFDKQFLDTASPEVTIISVGERNRYGHPAREIIDLLQDTNSKILRTDQIGTVKLVSDGQTFSVKK